MRTVKTALSVQKRKIELIEASAPPHAGKALNILITGVFHGDEPQGKFLIEKYLEQDLSDIKNNLYFIPCLNPDGMALNIRQNADGVDLNRNFPSKNWRRTDKPEYFGGTMAASEPETKFMIEIINERRFDAVLSIHAPFKIVNYDGPAENLALKISQLSGYPVQADIGYPSPGSFGTYAGAEKQIPVITLELDENDTFENLWKINKKIFDYLAFNF